VFGTVEVVRGACIHPKSNTKSLSLNRKRLGSICTGNLTPPGPTFV
jgi:hypothetical protein